MAGSLEYIGRQINQANAVVTWNMVYVRVLSTSLIQLPLSVRCLTIQLPTNAIRTYKLLKGIDDAPAIDARILYDVTLHSRVKSTNPGLPA